MAQPSTLSGGLIPLGKPSAPKDISFRVGGREEGEDDGDDWDAESTGKGAGDGKSSSQKKKKKKKKKKEREKEKGERSVKSRKGSDTSVLSSSRRRGGDSSSPNGQDLSVSVEEDGRGKGSGNSSSKKEAYDDDYMFSGALGDAAKNQRGWDEGAASVASDDSFGFAKKLGGATFPKTTTAVIAGQSPEPTLSTEATVSSMQPQGRRTTAQQQQQQLEEEAVSIPAGPQRGRRRSRSAVTSPTDFDPDDILRMTEDAVGGSSHRSPPRPDPVIVTAPSPPRARRPTRERSTSASRSPRLGVGRNPENVFTKATPPASPRGGAEHQEQQQQQQQDEVSGSRGGNEPAAGMGTGFAGRRRPLGGSRPSSALDVSEDTSIEKKEPPPQQQQKPEEEQLSDELLDLPGFSDSDDNKAPPQRDTKVHKVEEEEETPRYEPSAGTVAVTKDRRSSLSLSLSAAPAPGAGRRPSTVAVGGLTAGLSASAAAILGFDSSDEDDDAPGGLNALGKRAQDAALGLDEEDEADEPQEQGGGGAGYFPAADAVTRRRSAVVEGDAKGALGDASTVERRPRRSLGLSVAHTPALEDTTPSGKRALLPTSKRAKQKDSATARRKSSALKSQGEGGQGGAGTSGLTDDVNSSGAEAATVAAAAAAAATEYSAQVLSLTAALQSTQEGKQEERAAALEKELEAARRRVTELEECCSRLREEKSQLEIRHGEELLQEHKTLQQQLAQAEEKYVSEQAIREEAHQEAIAAVKRVHLEELSTAKRRAADANVLSDLATQIQGSAGALRLLQTQMQARSEAVEVTQTSQMEARERLVGTLEEHARTTQGAAENELQRLQGVLATMDTVMRNLRGQNGDERERLRQEHLRLEALQTSLLGEGEGMRQGLELERKRLADRWATLEQDKARTLQELGVGKAQLEEQQARLSLAQSSFEAAQEASVQREQARDKRLQEESDRLQRARDALQRDVEVFEGRVATARTDLREAERSRAELEQARRDIEEGRERLQRQALALAETVEEVERQKRQGQDATREAQRVHKEGQSLMSEALAAKRNLATQVQEAEQSQRRSEADRLAIAKARTDVLLEKGEARRLRLLLETGLSSAAASSQQQNQQQHYLYGGGSRGDVPLALQVQRGVDRVVQKAALLHGNNSKPHTGRHQGKWASSRGPKAGQEQRMANTGVEAARKALGEASLGEVRYEIEALAAANVPHLSLHTVSDDLLKVDLAWKVPSGFNLGTAAAAATAGGGAVRACVDVKQELDRLEKGRAVIASFLANESHFVNSLER